jgi:hypothetical protein
MVPEFVTQLHLAGRISALSWFAEARCDRTCPGPGLIMRQDPGWPLARVALHDRWILNLSLRAATPGAACRLQVAGGATVDE